MDDKLINDLGTIIASATNHRKCMTDCDKLVSLARSTDSRIVPSHIPANIATETAAFLDVAERSADNSQQAARIATSLLESNELGRLKEFIPETARTLKDTQEQLRRSREGMKRVIGETNGIIHNIEYQVKDMRGTAKRWALFGALTTMTIIGSGPGVAMLGRAAYVDSRADARRRAITLLKEIVALMEEIQSGILQIADWWSPVIEGVTRVTIAPCSNGGGKWGDTKSGTLDSQVERLLRNFITCLQVYAGVIKQPKPCEHMTAAPEESRYSSQPES